MLMASGANFGFQRTLPHLLGVGIGFVLMTLIVGAGLAQVLEGIFLQSVQGQVAVVFLPFQQATALQEAPGFAALRPALLRLGYAMRAWHATRSRRRSVVRRKP
jgi:hypothetical protein